MRKKEYIKPQAEVMIIRISNSILTISDHPDNYDVHDEEVDAGNSL